MQPKSRFCLLVLSLSAAVCFSASPTNLRVAIYSGTGAESDKTLALYRAVASCGHTPLAIVKSDIVNGRLTTNNYPVFIIPAGEDGQKCCSGHFSDVDALGAHAEDEAIRAYVNAGGGVVALEAGAFYASANGGTLDIYLGNYNWTKPVAGKQTFTIVDAAFGGGPQEAWMSYGGGYFSSAPTTAFTKKPMKPRLVPCRFSKASLCSERRRMTWLMSASLKVVNMAAVFLALTKRSAMR